MNNESLEFFHLSTRWTSILEEYIDGKEMINTFLTTNNVSRTVRTVKSEKMKKKEMELVKEHRRLLIERMYFLEKNEKLIAETQRLKQENEILKHKIKELKEDSY